MKNPINIGLGALIIILIGFTIYKNMDGGSNSNNGSTPEGPVDTNAYTIIEVAGTPVKLMEKYGENNTLIESGETLNDLKTGIWTTYYPNGRVKSISSYLAGELNGVQVNLSNKGHVELQAFYKNGLLEGNWTTYKNGSRKQEERVYYLGKLNGINRHYEGGKLQKEIGFKNDVQHGIFKYYDKQGNVIMEYEYENGEKISGGIVEE